MGNEKARKLCGQTWEKAVVGEFQLDGMLGDLELWTVCIWTDMKVYGGL